MLTAPIQPIERPPALFDVSGGRLRWNFHSEQARAFHSKKRFTLILAGTQGGKSAVGPPWLLSKIKELGPGDYYVVGPSFALLEIKAIPEFLRLFSKILKLGTYTRSPIRQFRISQRGERVLFGRADQEQPTTIYFAYGANPESLEAATAKAAWVDEAGQGSFKLESWEALQRRLSISQGPVLFTTTPYNLGWLKTEIFDPWNKAQRDGLEHPTIAVINFPSVANPSFPRAEFERMRRIMPRWRFNMFYLGRFERPAGQIYSNFERARHTIKRFDIPDSWPRALGLDFGGVNTAGVFLAREMIQPDPNEPARRGHRLYAYREYHEGERTAARHVSELRTGEPHALTAVGGSLSENDRRLEFGSAGLPVHAPPIKDVEVGIDRVFGAFAEDQLIIFSDLEGTIGQIEDYSRVTDEYGEPTETIRNKEAYHFLDALRYIISYERSGVDTTDLMS